MSARTSKALKALLGLVVLGGCLVVGMIAAGLVWLRAQPQGPDVLLHAPGYGSTVPLGEVVEVRAVARHARGVTRVEVWVDGELIAVRTSALAEGSTPFPITLGWVPETAGRHTLVVRAYDRSQGSGQATTIVEAEEGPPPAVETSYVVQEGDTLASVAEGYGLTAEELAAANPGVEEPLAAGTSLTLPPPVEDEGPAPTPEPPPAPLPGEAPPDPMDMRPLTLLERLVSIGRPPRAEGVRIEVEVLSLDVSDDFDGVYCYYTLGGEAMERVPADGYLEPAGGRSWAIEPLMAGDRRRVFLLPEGSESLTLQGQCLGYRDSRAGGEVSDLGTMLLTLGPDEWDGSMREALAEGREGWFRIHYRVASWSAYGPPPRPSTAEEESEGIVLLKECQSRWIGTEWIEALSREVEINRQLVECTLWVDPASFTGHADYLLFLRGGSPFRTVDLRGMRADPAGLTLVGISNPVIAGTDAAYAMYYHFGLTEETFGLPGPGETIDFQALAWSDDSTYSALSNIVSIRGAELWLRPYLARHVRLTLYEMDTGCLRADTVRLPGTLDTWGIGPDPRDADGHPIRNGCDDDLEDWGSVSGGLDVNGIPAFRVSGDLHSYTRYQGIDRYWPPVTLYLLPTEDLVLDMILWDYDVSSSNDPFCDATVVHPARELEEIRSSGGGSMHYRGQPFVSREGGCYLHYLIEVRN